MRISVEKSDENKKMSLIFLTACFIGMSSGFLIGYITGIIGGVLFGTGFRNTITPREPNEDFDIEFYSMITSIIPASLYIYGSLGIFIRKKEYSRLDMRRHMIVSGALVTMGLAVTVLTTTQYTYIFGPNVLAFGFGILYQ
ncbi:hypothetical protein MKW94_003306, partial [Papaver nudicaule]|nr:hypothetical protein [Papaver nudicaule]